MDVLEAIAQRHSCRRYEETAVEQGTLDQLLRAAQSAPAACGRYDQIHLTVIQSPDFLAQWDRVSALYAGAPKSHPLYGAPAVILISVLLAPDIPPANPYLNAGCVAENIALAATGLGLGSVLLASPVRGLQQCGELLETANLPRGFQPAIAVAIGCEAQQPHSIAIARL